MSRHKKRLVILLALLLLLGGIGTANWYRHLFTPNRWQQKPEQRQYMLESLEHKYQLVGMSREEVISLLGEPEEAQTGFKGDSAYYPSESTLVYYIGCDPVFRADMQWLILPLAEGRVVAVKIGLT